MVECRLHESSCAYLCGFEDAKSKVADAPKRPVRSRCARFYSIVDV